MRSPSGDILVGGTVASSIIQGRFFITYNKHVFRIVVIANSSKELNHVIVQKGGTIIPVGLYVRVMSHLSVYMPWLSRRSQRTGLVGSSIKYVLVSLSIQAVPVTSNSPVGVDTVSFNQVITANFFITYKKHIWRSICHIQQQLVATFYIALKTRSIWSLEQSLATNVCICHHLLLEVTSSRV